MLEKCIRSVINIQLIENINFIGVILKSFADKISIIII